MNKFKEALSEIPFIGTHGSYFQPDNQYALTSWMIKHSEVVDKALQIAERLQEEPSIDMKGKGSDASYQLDEVRPSIAAKIFRAMVDQMMKEIEHD